MLLFGINPQLHLPHTEVTCIRYADDLGAGKYLDRKNFLGTITELIDQTTGFVERHMNVGAEITGWKRTDRPEYPIPALREAITNALAHRDYTLRDQTVRVFMYQTRIEIHSPGILLPGITIPDLLELRVLSRPRNYLFASYLRDIPGYMERIGSGIRLMFHEMRQMDLPDPQFVEQHEFVVIFHTRPTALAPVAEDLGLTDRQLQGLQMVREVGSISTSEYMRATGASERTAYRELQEMVQKGVLSNRGNRRTSRYYLP